MQGHASARFHCAIADQKPFDRKSTGNRPEIVLKSSGYRPEIDRKQNFNGNNKTKQNKTRPECHVRNPTSLKSPPRFVLFCFVGSRNRPSEIDKKKLKTKQNKTRPVNKYYHICRVLFCFVLLAREIDHRKSTGKRPATFQIGRNETLVFLA